MAIEEVKLPEISENVDSGEVIKVLVSEGDKVEKEQGLVELETDKAAFEVPSSAAGTVKEILVEAGDTINVGDTIAKIETSAEGGDEEAAEEEPEEEAEAAGDEKKKEEVEEKEEKKEQAEAEPEEDEDEDEDEGEEGAAEKPKEDRKQEKAKAEEEEKKEKKERRKKTPAAKDKKAPRTDTDRVARDPAPASPSVRRLARELGVDIHDVEGSGPGGRITSEDVHAFAKSIITGGGAAAPPEAAAARELPDFSRYGEVERAPMSKIQQVMARNLAAAWNTVPHVTQNDIADITGLEAARKRFGKKAEDAGGKLTMTAILLKVCASALHAFPDFNASIDTDANEIIFKKYINIGVAVDTDRGLLVPVIRDVDEKNIVELSVELSEVAEKARSRKISPDMLEGGNFTLSNLGGIGGTSFTPIVYHPEVAILGVSRAARRPVWRGEGFQPRLMLPLSLSYDHRIIDGASAARFARWVAEALENPILLALEG